MITAREARKITKQFENKKRDEMRASDDYKKQREWLIYGIKQAAAKGEHRYTITMPNDTWNDVALELKFEFEWEGYSVRVGDEDNVAKSVTVIW